MSFYYGIDFNSCKNVTEIVLLKCVENNTIYVSGYDGDRVKLFDDPFPYKNKFFIYIDDENNTYKYKEGESFTLNIENNRLIEYFFTKIYYINLDSSVERKNIFEKRARSVNLSVQRVKAIDGNLNYIDNFITGHIMDNVCKKIYACTVSHATSIKKAYMDGNEYAIIAEDDFRIDILGRCSKKINQLIRNNFKNPVWDTLILVSSYDYTNLNTDFIKWEIDKPFGTMCYIITQEKMVKIINSFDDNNKLYFRFGTAVVADAYLYDNMTYLTSSPFGFSDETESIIHSSHLESNSFESNKQKNFLVNNWNYLANNSIIDTNPLIEL